MLARIRKSVQEKDAGFTLVELLVVMIIIGILAAIAIPVFLNQRQKAVDSSIKSDLRTVAQEVESAYVDSQTYPASTTYVPAGTPATGTAATGTLFTAARLSKGNAVTYKSVTNGYCLRGQNSDGSTGTTNFFFYDSTTGGLKTGAAAASSGSC